MTRAIEEGRRRLTIGRIMLGIAVAAFPMTIARRDPVLGVTAGLYVLWFGLIRSLIRGKRREIERDRPGSVEPDDRPPNPSGSPGV